MTRKPHTPPPERGRAGGGRPRTSAAKPRAAKPKLLAGGNPQIVKGEGAAPVRAWIAAIPDTWKRDIARRIDKVVTRVVPGVHKAVKWNSPFYGTEPGIWFLSIHCYTKFVKCAFFKGAELTPLPPGKSSQKNVRYLDARDGELDEKQFAAWVKQAAKLPGAKM